MFAVNLAKTDDFIGKTALLTTKDKPLRKKLVTVVMGPDDAYVWGGEALALDGEPVGEISSAGWSDSAGRCVALGYVRGEAAARLHVGGAITVDVWGDSVAASTWDFWNPAASAARRPR